MVDASNIDLPEALDGIFAEMQDKADSIRELAKQLFEVASEKTKPESNEK